MKTLFFVNGKHVDINTYFSAVGSNIKRELLWEACTRYYKTHPIEFELVYHSSNEKDFAFNLMQAYEWTEDYKKQWEEINSDDGFSRGCILVFLLIFVFSVLILPFILIFSGALD